MMALVAVVTQHDHVLGLLESFARVPIGDGLAVDALPGKERTGNPHE